MVIRVHTGEAESLEEYPDIYNQGNEYARIETDDETYVVFVRVMATFDGPGTFETMERTTLYMSDDTLGAEPVSLEEGLDRLQAKIGMDLQEFREWQETQREE